MSLANFHPLIERWFATRFGQPTEPQRLGWPEIQSGNDTLIAAPTGSGKTLAAFLVCIDRLLRQSLQETLESGTQVIYVSPLKALSNDVHRNLETPLEEINAAALEAHPALDPIKVGLRTGDTPNSQRQSMVRRPPHILVTTPESLYLLLTSPKAREILRTVNTVIVDEIHALARDKRGSHLTLSLERLDVLCDQRPTRIGLSATQRPLERIAQFLVGESDATRIRERCRMVDVGHLRKLDLDVEVPPSELSAVCSNEQWDEVYARLVELISTHRSTLIFVNTRRLAERVAHRLSETLGPEAVASHHGSLAREIRLNAEQRLKSGELRVIVATASLELGIDVGYIDLVCQVGSPRSIATLLQRVGRAGHSLGALPKGRLFPLTRDDLLEGLALLRAVRTGQLDQVEIPEKPLDILAQQIVAAVAVDEWDEDELYNLCRRGFPFREVTRSQFDSILTMLSEGIEGSRRYGAYLHRDRINGKLRARRGARIAAATSGGAIPDNADYFVYTEGDRTLVGTVNEDFAIESMAGDIFLLGNTSWQIRSVRGGEVTVRDAQGAPANVPFWFGEAPGRTDELSTQVSELRVELADRLKQGLDNPQTQQAALQWLCESCGCGEHAARQAVGYVAAQLAAIEVVPSRRQIVFERFFDESGGMQLVIHAPLGARINRAWGLALRKRFCRSFNFELQASADDNGIVLSLGPQHSFVLDDMFRMVNPTNAEHILKQAMLDSPMFLVRWRWNATRALAVLRRDAGKKVPSPLQRFRADDILTAVFPSSTACLENVVGDIEIPEHPLVDQTVYDCLHEAMDLPRWLELLREIEQGSVTLLARDTREPSPFSHELLNANPYAFLDDAPLEERRARAVATRRSFSPEDVRDLAKLDPEAIAQVRREAWPLVRDADELHDALLSMIALSAEEGQPWRAWLEELCSSGRACEVTLDNGRAMWVAAERLATVQAVYPRTTAQPNLSLPEYLRQLPEESTATTDLVRGHIEVRGPITVARIVNDLSLAPTAVQKALATLEVSGQAMQGSFETLPGSAETTNGNPTDAQQWCERRLLSRIHRLTLSSARQRVRPVEPRVFLRFLCEHQHLSDGSRLEGRHSLTEVIWQLQGFELAAAAWEADIVPARLQDYDPQWLDELTMHGEVVWGRLKGPQSAEEAPRRSMLTPAVPLSFVPRSEWRRLLPEVSESTANGSGTALDVLETLRSCGAQFTDDLLTATGLLPAQLDDALAELIGLGLVTADGLGAIRKRITPDARRRARASRLRNRSGHRPMRSTSSAGRWSVLPRRGTAQSHTERAEAWAKVLLARYGVVFRDLLTRESAAPPWSQIVPVLRRMEVRGEVLGGRFVGEVSGEQYALSSAVEHLRRLREQPPSGKPVVVSAVDPINLLGIITADARIPAKRSNTLALVDGVLIATRIAEEIVFHQEVEIEQRQKIERALRVNGIVRAADALAENEKLETTAVVN